MTRYWSMTKFLLELKKAKLSKMYYEYRKCNSSMNDVDCANRFVSELREFRVKFGV